MQEELVSVIIPTYNRAHLIEQAARSVLSQTYRTIELIIVDDASTDDTEDVIKKIDDSRLKYVRLEKNSGACKARNEGIKSASGAYIAFNDSDDKWTPEKIEFQLSFLKSSGADVVLCRMECFDDSGQFLHCFPNLDEDKAVSYHELLSYNCASTQTFFGKAECFKEILFDDMMPRLQDWDEALRLAKKFTLVYQNKVLVKTFIQKDSISAHPEKGEAAMEKLWNKHRTEILSSRCTAESFLKKKSAFLCLSGKNPKKEMRILYRHFPSVKNLLRLLLAETGLYRILFLLRK